MRNKGFFWSITIGLVLACIYQLSFTYATTSVESDATEYAEAKIDSIQGTNTFVQYIGKDTFDLTKKSNLNALTKVYKEEYLKSQMNVPAHFFGATYGESKEKEINLGLDLKGGMSATLELSVPDLVSELAGGTRSQAFKVPFDKANERTNAGDGAFIDNFVEEFENANKDVALSKIFHMYNPEDVAADATNDQVAAFLKDQANKALDGVEIIIEKRVNQFGVAQPTIQKQAGTNRISVELPGVSDKETVRKRLQATANLEFYEVYDNAQNGIAGILLQSEQSLAMNLYGEELMGSLEPEVEDSTTLIDNLLGEQDSSDNSVIDPLLDPIDDLLDGTETEVPAAEETKKGILEIDDSLLTPQQRQMKRPISSILNLAFEFTDEGQIAGYRSGSAVGYANVKDTADLNARLKNAVVRANLPQDLRFMWDAKEFEDADGLPTGFVNLHAIKVPMNGPKVSGKDIKTSSVDDSQIGQYAVSMTMNDIGASKWKEMTTDNLNRQVAITMDNYVFSAPVVNEAMDYRSSITGNFSVAEASDLSGLLNAGALPAPVKIVDESIVGPSLGAANISAGLWSFVFALLIVLVYMVFYYNKAGLVADAALIINIFLLVGALASLKAILTLPGIAGIVLTIGMSVDANVLIFERIREELRNGKGVKASIKEGYAKALSAILDANVTTLLTGIVLAVFGTGPIKGFATTLIIGIFTSFFAAVIITRLIITSISEKDKKMSFSSKLTEKWFTKTNVQFVKKRKLFYLVSAAVITLGIVSLIGRGLDYGVDFAGGRQYKVHFTDQEADNAAIKTALTAKFDGNEPGVKTVDDDFTVLVTTKYRILDTASATNNDVQKLLEEGVATFGEYEVTESKMIAPTISKDLKTNSFYAIGISLLVIFLYILIRFKRWQYGLGALIAMAHDVLIVLSIFSIGYGWIGFSMEIDQAFIAAILTVVGYSINDTVVVFDRIREYLGLYPKKDSKEVINMALNSTLGRTVNTSVSTFIVLLVIFIFGGGAIQGLVFALMVGVVVGTYSSLFIATPTVIDFSKKREEKK